MKAKIIGIGQCGSRVVQDLLNRMFPTVPSSLDIRARAAQSEFGRYIEEITAKLELKYLKAAANVQQFVRKLPVADKPSLYVIDGNTDNAIINGLSTYGERLKNLLFCKSIPLKFRDGGCHISVIGQSLFKKTYDENFTPYKESISINKNEQLCIIYSSTGGGTGSGGCLSLNNQLSSIPNKFLLLNIVVAPEYNTRDYRYKWNTGRYFQQVKKKNYSPHGVILVSNEGEDIKNQNLINKYITELSIRIINSKYKANTPVIATEADLNDLISFFQRDIVIAGLGTLSVSNNQKINLDDLFKQCFRFEKNPLSGLSINVENEEIKKNCSAVLILIGIPPTLNPTAFNRIEQSINKKLDAIISSDIEIILYSYGSNTNVEMSLFLGFDDVYSLSYVNHFTDTYTSCFSDKVENEKLLFDSIRKGDVNKRSLKGLCATLDSETTKDLPIDYINKTINNIKP